MTGSDGVVVATAGGSPVSAGAARGGAVPESGVWWPTA
ncbi:hypothetical protein JOF41_003109 [Saccharothrix coeruleofusca]|nr:hypothetical protein [Saccharothrix coeruleofusca]